MDFIIHTGTYLLHFMCVFLDVQTNSISSIWKSHPIGQIFFKEGLILLVWGNSYYSKELFEHSINCNRSKERHTTPIFLSAPQMTSQLTIISTDHSFFRLSDASVFSNVFLIMPLNTFFPKLGNVMSFNLWFNCILNAFCSKN